MKASTKISLLLFVLIVAVTAIAAQFISVRHQTIKQAAYTTNTGELTRDVLVGQTFKSESNNLSAIAVMFATYSNRNNTGPVAFYLRDSYDSAVNLRTATVQPEALNDNQLYRFEFEPLPDSKGKAYFFFVVSPEGKPAASVTVDLDTRNPYHLGSAFVVRGQGSDITNPVTLARSGKPTQDIGFATFHTVPLRTAVITTTRAALYRFIASWHDQRSQYFIMARVAVPTVAFMGLVLVLHIRSRRTNKMYPLSSRTTLIILSILFIAGIAIRLMYATQLPVTDDEGNYLYDAQSLLRGILAGGDGYVKAPLTVAWVALWQLILGNTVLAGRVASIVIGMATMFPIYCIGRNLKNRRTGILAATAWSLFGATILAHVYVHTQPVALFFGISGIALVWSSLRRFNSFTQPTPFSQPKLDTWRLVAGGALLGLAVASRKSVLALGLIPLLLVITHQPTWRKRLDALFKIGLGFIVVMAIFILVAYLLYGTVGVYEALGIASAEDGQLEPEASEVAKVRSYSLRGMTPFFRESLPLIVLSLVGWGYLLESWVRQLLRVLFSQKPSRTTLFIVDQVLPKAIWLLPLLAFWWCFAFFFEYEGEAFMFFGMRPLWWALAGVLITAALWPRPRHEAFVFEERIVPTSTQPLKEEPLNVVGRTKPAQPFPVFLLQPHAMPSIANVLLLPLWLGGLGFFYLNWIKFHANYINEFLPPLIIMAGVGSHTLWQRFWTPYWEDAQYPIRELSRKLLALVITGVLMWAIFLSNYITYLYEHTGTFEQRAVNEAAIWARQHIPLEQPIFTGAAIVPYLSGHHTALDIAHPRWYAYEFTRKNPDRLNVFLPSIDDMLAAYRSSQWFLMDKQTGFSFLMEYGEIEKGLAQDFVAIQGISNGSNTLTFYRRK